MGKTTIADKITEDIRRDILSGKLAPHERLRETVLAEKYGVSRTPIRESLNTLVDAGLVKFIPYCGAEVAPINLGEINEIYQVRKVLEGMVVELATPVMSDEQINTLIEYVENMDIAINNGDYQSYSQIHEEFHLHIYNNCPNRFLTNLTTGLMARSVSFRRSSWITINRTKEAQKYHHLICERIKAKDACGAKAANERHIQLIIDDLKRNNVHKQDIDYWEG